MPNLERKAPSEEYTFRINKSREFKSIDFNKKLSELVKMKGNTKVTIYVTTYKAAKKLNELDLKLNEQNPSSALIMNRLRQVKMLEMGENKDLSNQGVHLFSEAFQNHEKLIIDVSNGQSLDPDSALLLANTLSNNPKLKMSVCYQNEYMEDMNLLYNIGIHFILGHLALVEELKPIQKEILKIISSYLWDLQRVMAMFTEKLSGGTCVFLAEDHPCKNGLLLLQNPAGSFICSSKEELIQIGDIIQNISHSSQQGLDQKVFPPLKITANLSSDKKVEFIEKTRSLFTKHPLYADGLCNIEQEKQNQSEGNIVTVNLLMHGIYRPHVEAFVEGVELLKTGADVRKGPFG